MNILDEIVASVRDELKSKKRALPIEAVKEKAFAAPPPRDFRSALTAQGRKVRIIAEIKRASPSKGDINSDLNPAIMAQIYENSGAVALSVLTEPNYFKGSLKDLEAAKNSCSLPAIRKDFIVDEYQIYEARAHGADAILLIVACLNENELKTLLELAHSLKMTALVEAHDEAELKAALDAGARVVGINNRDLKVFKTDINTTVKLADKVPDNVVLVSESGISTPEHILKLLDAGVDSFLIGEALVKAGDPRKKLAELINLQACRILDM